MTDSIPLAVRSGDGTGQSHYGFLDVVELIERVPRQHSGWQSINYKGQRYKLWGGIRTNFWINLTMPIKGRQ